MMNKVIPDGADNSEGGNRLQGTIKAGVVQLFFLGMGIVLSGDVDSWNGGLRAGFWSFFLAVSLVCLGYMCLVASLAELTSIIAFSGGSFGYVRSTMGPFIGYIVACNELLLYNFYSITGFLSAGRCISAAVGTPREYEAIYFLGLYIIIGTIHFREDYLFWAVIIACAAVTILILVVYCLAEFFGRTDTWHFSLIDSADERFVGGGPMFIEIFYIGALFFLGIETLTVVGGKIPDGTKVLPKALWACFICAAVIGFGVIFATVIQYQDIGISALHQTIFPLTRGLLRNMDIARKYGPVMAFPATFSAAIGFLYASKHIILSMARSGLLPSFFGVTYGPQETPVRALVVCSAVQYVVLLIGWAQTDNLPYFELSLMGASFTYVGIFGAYLIFKYKFAHMERGMRSPFGLVGAIFGSAVFGIIFFSVAIYQMYQYLIVVFLGYLFLCSVYYFGVVESRQYFSPEEQRHFMKAYILNANKRKKLSPMQRVLASIKANLFSGACCPSFLRSSLHSGAETSSNHRQSSHLHLSRTRNGAQKSQAASKRGQSAQSAGQPGDEEQAGGGHVSFHVTPAPSIPAAADTKVDDGESAEADVEQGGVEKDNGEVRSAVSTQLPLDVEEEEQTGYVGSLLRRSHQNVVVQQRILERQGGCESMEEVGLPV